MARMVELRRVVANRFVPRLRLGSFLLVIDCLAVGLSWETDRRRREIEESASRRLRDLRLIADERRQRGEEYRLRALALEAEAETIRRNGNRFVPTFNSHW